MSCVSNGKKYIKVSEDIDLKNLIRESVYEIDKMPGFNPYDGKDFWVWQRRDSLFIVEDGLAVFPERLTIKNCYQYNERNIWIINEFKPKYNLFKKKSEGCQYVMHSTGYSGSAEIILNGMIYKLKKTKTGMNYQLVLSGNMMDFVRKNEPFKRKMVIIPEPEGKLPK